MSFISSDDLNNKRSNNIYDKSTNSQNELSVLDLKILEQVVHKKFSKKYNKMPSKYNKIKIDNIIFNDKIHLVSVFKELLLINDQAEFLKRFYALYESVERLPKYFKFYDLYSKIFPNYTSIEEGKYFYKNIQQKQRVINTIEKIELEAKNRKNKKNKNSNNENDEKVFSTNVIDSLLNSTNDEAMEMIFNVNKQNIKKDESCFVKDLQNLIDEIGNYPEEKENIDYLNQKKHINYVVKINNNKYIIKIKNINCQNSNNNSNINNIKREFQMNSTNKYSNKTTKPKSKINTENKENYNIFNLQTKNNYTKLNLYQKPNIKNQNIPKLILIDKLENNTTRTRQKYSHYIKSFSHNISTSVKSRKNLSNSRQNKSLYTRIQNLNSENNNITYCYKKYSNGQTYVKNKRKNNDILNYKKEILKIDLSRAKLSSRNNVLNFSLNKINNVNKHNFTNHNSFIIKSNNKNSSKNNILNNTNIIAHNGTNKNQINNDINYNFHVIENYSRNKSLKNINKIKKCETNRNSKDSKDKNYYKKKLKYIKRNSSKIDGLFNTNTNTKSMMTYNVTKNNKKINAKHRHLNSILYLSNLTTRKESKKSNSKKPIINEENLNSKNKNELNIKKEEIIKKHYSFKNINTSKILTKNNSILKINANKTKIVKNSKIKNIKINNFSKLFNVFIKHSKKDNDYNYNPLTERNRVKIKI